MDVVLGGVDTSEDEPGLPVVLWRCQILTSHGTTSHDGNFLQSREDNESFEAHTLLWLRVKAKD